MSRTLYLHIGSHKTGSTSIQNFLARNQGVLAKRGVGYATGSNPTNLNGEVGATGLGGPDDDEYPLAERALRVARLILQQKTDHVIASSEGFSYLFDHSAIALYHDLLAPAFSTIKIMSFLRRQDQFAVSHHQEGANPQDKPAARLHGHSPTALPEISALQHKYLDYETRIGRWGDVFGDAAMALTVYDRAVLKNGDCVAHFLDAAGLGDIDLTGTPEKNTSMGLAETKLGHILHAIVTDQNVRANVQRRLPATDRMLPRRDDARAFLHPYIAGNRRLNARFSISNNPDLFSDDFAMFPEGGNQDWTEPTADAAIRACAEVIEQLSEGAVTFSQGEYRAAAKALRSQRPDIAEKFLAAAQAIKPQSDRITHRLEKLATRREKANDSADPSATLKGRRAERGAKKRGT